VTALRLETVWDETAAPAGARGGVSPEGTAEDLGFGVSEGGVGSFGAEEVMGDECCLPAVARVMSGEEVLS